jgi:hypothetical protein
MSYPKKTGEHTWILQVQEDGKTKELYIELPPEALAQVGWDIGDTLLWEELDNGQLGLRKKDATKD